MTPTRSELARLLDHSVLKPEAVEADVPLPSTRRQPNQVAN